MAEHKYYGNYALCVGVLFFVTSVAWSLWYAADRNRLVQEYAIACNKAGGYAIAPDGMYQCIRIAP